MAPSSILLLAFISGVAFGEQKCQGTPRMYNNKHCASTTRYADRHKGACGCGPTRGDNQYDWNHSGYNAKANQLLFDTEGSTWCGKSCGRCIRLTTTGGSVHGGQHQEGISKVFMITNVCTTSYPNTEWCGQTQNHTVNTYGYGWHFDLENGARQVNNLGWDNAEVTWEWADCDQGHSEDHRTSTDSMYSQCYCSSHHSKRSDDTD